MRAGVERVVYTSSVATLAARTDGVSPTRPCRSTEAQGDRRLQAQQGRGRAAVEAMIAREGLPAVIVNPSTPIGPRDVKPTPTGRIIVEAASRPHAGLRRYRAQHGARRRRRRGPSRRASSAAGSASATCSAARMPCSPRCWRRSPSWSDGAPPRIRIPRRALMPFAHADRSGRPRHRPRAVADARRPAHGEDTRCSFPRPRPSGSSAFARGPIAKGSKPRIDGFGTPATCGGNERIAARDTPRRAASSCRLECKWLHTQFYEEVWPCHPELKQENKYHIKIWYMCAKVYIFPFLHD